MAKKIITILLFFALNTLLAQQYELVYYSYNNGIRNEGGDMNLLYKNDVLYLSDANSSIRNFTDFQKKENVSVIAFDGKLYKTIHSLDSLPKIQLSGETANILGYECKHGSYTYFSNKIEVWFTHHPEIKGSPYQRFLPDNNALVLKIRINNSRLMEINTLREKETSIHLEYPYTKANTITDPEMEELKIRSRYQRLEVFSNQQINFDPSLSKPIINNQSDGTVYRLSNGTVVLKKILLPDLVSEGAYIFASLKCRSNGDAYDRTGSVFAILSNKKINMLNALKDSISVVPSFTDNKGRIYQGFSAKVDFEPALELMRFFTSFGAGHFNDKRVIANYPWNESVSYKQEITQLIPNDNKEIWIGVFIGNYDKGGHIIDLDLHFYPSFEPVGQTTKWIKPLFNTLNIMEMSGQNYPRLFDNDTLEIEFTVPKDLMDIDLLFTTTGHGGWGGGDEFNPRLNRLVLDGEEIFRIIPWRSDCARYRLDNPASGNFGNGLSSSDLSRSNWCPATSTPPFHILIDTLKPGEHHLQVIIDQGEDEGNSFNAWSVSGVLTGRLKNGPLPVND